MRWPCLRAAAGWASDAHAAGGIDADEVALPGDFDRGRSFAVRASGESMSGAAIPWRTAIHDGDWLVFRWARGSALAALAAS